MTKEVIRNGRNCWCYGTELRQLKDIYKLGENASGNDLFVAMLKDKKVTLSKLRALNRIDKNLNEDADISKEIKPDTTPTETEKVKAHIVKLYKEGLTKEQIIEKMKKSAFKSRVKEFFPVKEEIDLF